MNKKKLLSLALVVIMIAILSFSSLAWFTDNETVKNDFLIAGSDDGDADEIFSVDVWEDKDGDGQPDDELTNEEEGLVYPNILPGDLLKKNVYVENTGSYNQFIRVTVTVSDAHAWIAAVGQNADLTTIIKGFDATKWNHIWNNVNEAVTNGQPIPETLEYVMFYNAELAPGQKITVFTDVQIPTSLTQQQAAAFEGGFSIDVKAEAIQTGNVVPEGTEAGDEAWAAFQYVAANS